MPSSHEITSLEQRYPPTKPPFDKSPINTEKYEIRLRGAEKILSYAQVLDAYVKREKAGGEADKQVVSEIVADLNHELRKYQDKKRRGTVLSADEKQLEQSIRRAVRLGEVLLGKGLASKEKPVNKEVYEKTVFDLMMESLRKDFPNLGIRDHLDKVNGIDFAAATDAEIKEYVDVLTTALIKKTEKEFLDATLSNNYPGEKMNILGGRLFAIESKVKPNPTLKDLLDVLPKELKPYKEGLQAKFLSIQIHHDRAFLFNDIFKKQEDKKIGSITAVYQSLGDDQGGYRPYDMGALYSRALPEGVNIPGATSDESWQLGNIINHTIAMAHEEIMADPNLNPFPWTEKQSNRARLEEKIKERLSRVNPPLSKDQIELGIKMAFWDIRSAGMEFYYDEKGVDQRFSRLMRIKEWVKSANSSAAKRAYEYTDEIGKIFERLMVTQEEFIHLTVVVPNKDIEYIHFSDLQRRLNILLGLQNPTKEEVLERSEIEALVRRYAKGTNIDSKVDIVKFKADSQQWSGAAREGKWVVIPKNHIRPDADPNQTRTHKQIHMRLSDIRRSNLDMKLADWETLTSSVNDKYAFVADKMEMWFENFGTITAKEAGQKFFADARKMQGHDFVPIEKTIELLRPLKVGILKGRLDLQSTRTAFGVGNSWQHGKKYKYDNSAIEIDERSDAAVKLSRDLRAQIHVAKLDGRDFDQWGFKSFFHTPNDYLINKLITVGGRFRKGVTNGKMEYTEDIPVLDLLRDLIRTRSGKFLPVRLEEALDEFEESKKPNTPDAANKKLRAVNKVQLEVFKLAIDLWLERYRYSEVDEHGNPEHFPIGSLREIETKSGRNPLDFIDIQVFISSVRQYCNELAGDMAGAANITDRVPDNFPDDKYIEDLMIEKGIIGTDASVQTDLLTVASKRFEDVPERGKRQEQSASGGDKKHK